MLKDIASWVLGHPGWSATVISLLVAAFILFPIALLTNRKAIVSLEKNGNVKPGLWAAYIFNRLMTNRCYFVASSLFGALLFMLLPGVEVYFILRLIPDGGFLYAVAASLSLWSTAISLFLFVSACMRRYRKSLIVPLLLHFLYSSTVILLSILSISVTKKTPVSVEVTAATVLMSFVELIAMAWYWLQYVAFLRYVSDRRVIAVRSRWFERTCLYPLLGLVLSVFEFQALLSDPGQKPLNTTISVLYGFITVTYLKQIFDECICPPKDNQGRTEGEFRESVRADMTALSGQIKRSEEKTNYRIKRIRRLR